MQLLFLWLKQTNERKKATFGKHKRSLNAKYTKKTKHTTDNRVLKANSAKEIVIMVALYVFFWKRKKQIRNVYTKKKQQHENSINNKNSKTNKIKSK